MSRTSLFARSALPLVAAALLAACRTSPPDPAQPPGGSEADRRLTETLSVMERVHARAEALLAGNPAPSSEQLVDAVRGAAGVADAGVASALGPAAWVQLGAGGPIQMVSIDPLAAEPQPAGSAARAHARAAAPGTGGSRFAHFQVVPNDPRDRGPGKAAELLASKGYERIMSSVADLNTLRNMGALKVLYLSTHSFHPGGAGSRGPAIYSVMTGEPVPSYRDGLSAAGWTAATRDDLDNHRLGVSTSCNARTRLCRDTWFINEHFVRKYFSFTEDSLFFLDACLGATQDAAGFRAAAFEKRLSVFVGWDGLVTWPDGWETANLFFDRFLGTNQVFPPDPPQRPFDAASVVAELRKIGLGSTESPEGGTAILKVFAGGPKFAGVPSTKSLQVDERRKELRLSGLFGTDPGPSRRRVELSGRAVEVTSWAPEEITAELPPGGASGEADVTVSADDRKGNEVQLTEWSLTLRHSGTTVIEGVGTSSGEYTFDVRFRTDVHDFREEAGAEPMRKVLAVFALEDGASLTWNGTATALDQTLPFSGSTSNLKTLDYTNPAWPFTLPDGDLLAGEGYVDLDQRLLYLFLVGVGDDSGTGTYNLMDPTSCRNYHDLTTNRRYLVFPLDERFEIADGECSDAIVDEKLHYSGTRSWRFTTRSPPDADAPR